MIRKSKSVTISMPKALRIFLDFQMLVEYLLGGNTAAYTGIGRDKLYEMTSLADCPFVLWVGNRRMIKRRIFDEYIEQMYSI